MERTFIVHIPDKNNFPFPAGTGFFISKNGYFITANHVLNNLLLEDNRHLRFSQPDGAHVLNISIEKQWQEYDLALLKANFELNKQRQYFLGKDGFPYLEIDFEQQLEGAPVYSYGFPLSQPKINVPNRIMTVIYSPRVTSAIISSQHGYIRPFRGSNDPKHYTIDKALAYGNSGGPVILSETGKVFAVVIQFQPTRIPQPTNNPIETESYITIPTNYAILSSLVNIKNYIIQEINI